jgi:hypothetical protein
MSRVTTFRNFTAGVLPIASNTEFRTVNGPAKELLVAFTRILPSVAIVSILQSTGMIAVASMESVSDVLILVLKVRRQTYDPTAKLIMSGTEAMPAELLREIVPDGQHFADSVTEGLPGMRRKFALPSLVEASELAYFSLAYSALACSRAGMPGSASFQRVRKSW